MIRPQKKLSFSPPAKVTLPLQLELEYMLDQRRLARRLEWHVTAALSKFREDQRQDADEGLRAFLQMSAPEILNEAKLRRRLRSLATTLTAQKLRELEGLLGRAVSAPAPGLIDEWINTQVIAIQASVQQWLATASKQIAESRTAGATVGEMVGAVTVASKELAKNAEIRASFRLLQLNSQIIEEVAKGAGSTHYRWITEEDSKVRPNHVPLHDSIQGWSSPPNGGGTRPGEPGHPGSGYGCRCLAEPMPRTRLPVTQAAPQAVPPAQGPG